MDLFFVLSGYLITGILYSSSNKPRYFRNFYIRRTLRIFPLYYTFIFLAAVVLPKFVDAHWLGLEALHGHVAPFFFYYTNYADVFIGWVPASPGAFWSLAVEEHFYLFWPALIKFIPRNKLIFSCAVVAVFALTTRLAITALRIPWPAAYFLTTSRLDSLAVGAMVAILIRQHPDWLKRWMRPIGAVAAGCLLVIAAWRHGLVFNDWPMRTIGYSLLAVLFGSVVFLAGTTHGRATRLLAHPVLTMFGKYSYCLYVCHVLVLAVCQNWIAVHLFPLLKMQVDAPLPLFALALTGSLMIALLSWHFYESRFLSLKERFAPSR